MSKRISGYQVTMQFLVPVDANDIASMKEAHETIDQISGMMGLQRDGGLIKALEIAHKFIQRREVPDAAVAGPLDVHAEFNQIRQDIGSPVIAKLADDMIVGELQMPPIPSAMKRS